MRKCQACQAQEATTAWQPFGPGETAACFTEPGWHYRGFPVVHICDDCKRRIRNGDNVGFTHRKEPYIAYTQAGRVQVGASPF